VRTVKRTPDYWLLELYDVCKVDGKVIPVLNEVPLLKDVPIA